MSLRTLKICRGHAASSLHEQVGYRLEVPAGDFPTEPPETDERSVAAAWEQLAREFDWPDPRRPGARLEEIDCTALVEPSRFERGYVDWVAARLGNDVKIRWPEPRLETASEAGAEIIGRLRSTEPDPWETPESLPEDGVRLIRTDTRRGEVRAAGLRIRSWLNERGLLDTDAAARACESVLILIPGDAESVGRWQRGLSQMDVPVRTEGVRTVAKSAFGRWVLDVAALRGWSSTEKRSRDLLRRIFESRFWCESTVAERLGTPGARLDLRVREALQSLRRDSVTLDQWLAHLSHRSERAGEKGETQQSASFQTLARFTELLLEHLPREGFFRQFGQLFREDVIGTATVIQADGTPDEESPLARQKLLRILSQLAYEEAAHIHEPDERFTKLEEGELTPRTILRDAFSRRGFLEGVDQPRHAVTLLPHEEYDGRESELLIVSGLGEGVYPHTPTLWTLHEETWARALGLVDDDSAEDASLQAAVAHVDRCIDLVATSVAKCCGQIIFSYYTEGDGSERVPPGPLLSLLVGGWTDQHWRDGHASADAVEVLAWADEVPADSGEARCWHDAKLFANDPQTCSSALAAAEDLSDPDRKRALAMKEIYEALEGTRRLRESQAPREEPRELNAHTGRLPGKARRREVFSATALEEYGQCAAKYFFGRILRLEEREDSPDEFDPMEVGNLVHEAFFRAAQDQIEVDGGELKTWRLTTPDEAQKARVVDAISDLVGAQFEAVSSRASEEEPSLSGALSAAHRYRWRQAIRNWVEQHVVPEEDLSADQVRLDESAIMQSESVVAAKRAVEEFPRKLDSTLEAVDEFEEFVREADSLTKTTSYDDFYERTDFIIKKMFESITGPASKGDWEAAYRAFEPFRAETIEKFETELRKAEKALGEAIDAERKRRQTTINRHVAHAELAFGLSDDRRRLQDPFSIEDPVILDSEHGEVALCGSIDRIDWDVGAGVLAVRDYKSGMSTLNEDNLRDKMAGGEHLQLPLYAAALQQLVDHDQPPHLAGSEVLFAGLEYPAAGKSTNLRLDADDDADGEPIDWRERAVAWAGAYTRAIDEGHFPPLPNRCPILSRSGYCDHESICRQKEHPLDPAMFQDPRVQPVVDLPESGNGADEKEPTEIVSPVSCGDEHPLEELRGVHDRAHEIAANVDADVVICAGAGTGKTHNLVLRYLRALESGASPAEILCITFTRKAAAEMKHRIRRVLLSSTPSGDEKLDAVARNVRESGGLRELLLQLSAAPISTIDALCGDLVRVTDELRGRVGSSPDVVSDVVIQRELDVHVAERFIEALEQRDPRLMSLIEEISVKKLRGELRDAVSAGIPDEFVPLLQDSDTSSIEAVARRLLDGWYAMMQRPLEIAEGVIAEWDVDEFAEVYAAAREKTGKTTAISEEVKLQLDVAIELLRQDTSRLPVGERWRRVAAVLEITTTGNSRNNSQLGNNVLRDWFRPRKKELYARLSDASCREATEEWGTFVDAGNAESHALLTAQMLSLVAEWERSLLDRLRHQGRLRYKDIERVAIESLTESEDAVLDQLAGRFPFRHIFVDESQDTSASQIHLIESLRDVVQRCPGTETSAETSAETGAEKCHEFWVGDVKQSIYRFRGAEVDVFNARLDLWRERGFEVGTLTKSWRSRPPLIHLINVLSSAMFECENADGDVLDPGSRVPYDLLTWPEKWDSSEEPDGVDAAITDPALEIIAVPGKGFEDLSGDDEESERESDADNEEETDNEEENEADLPLEASPRQLAIVRRVRELIDEDGADSGPIAVLVHSWARAARYRDLLAAYGVRADVEGGRGLLATREGRNLRLWLQAATHPEESSNLVALAQGPGFGISFAGIYCLVQKYGVENEGPDDRWLRREPGRIDIGKALRFGALDPDDAVDAWRAFDPNLDTDECREALEADARMLDKFREQWAGFSQAVGTRPTADVFEDLLDRSGLRAWWFDHPDGAQRVANVNLVLELIRSYEATNGIAPRELHRYLESICEADDPASGGLEASRGSDVIVTTIWQAKGREWGVVVLPDIEKVTSKGDVPTLGCVRVVMRNSDGGEDALMTAQVPKTDANKPFDVSKTAVDEVIKMHRTPGDRAELRRLLYVALTRAKHRVVMSAEVDGYRRKNQDLTMSDTTNWARLMRVCTGLGFDETMQPTFENELWRALRERGLVHLSMPGEERPETPEARPPTSDVPGADPISEWRVVTSPVLHTASPSGLKGVAPAPAPDPVLSEAFPDTCTEERTPFDAAHQEGTAFHYLMELWAFGTAGPLDDELVVRALRDLAMDAPDDPEILPKRVARLRTLIERAQTSEHLWATLEAAARRGDLFHELPITFADPRTDTLLRGNIDLFWLDDEGIHILDYKTGHNYPTRTESNPLNNESLTNHHAQVHAYARGAARLLDVQVVDYGVWYVAGGFVCRWGFDLDVSGGLSSHSHER